MSVPSPSPVFGTIPRNQPFWYLFFYSSCQDQWIYSSSSWKRLLSSPWAYSHLLLFPWGPYISSKPLNNLNIYFKNFMPFYKQTNIFFQLWEKKKPPQLLPYCFLLVIRKYLQKISVSVSFFTSCWCLNLSPPGFHTNSKNIISTKVTSYLFDLMDLLDLSLASL